MKPLRLLTLLLLALVLALTASRGGAATYEPGPDSVPHPGVPKGEVLHFTFDRSRIFPGTVRDYWVYVPAEYTPDHPACLYVNQDGVQWSAPTVFDNLISKKEMPVTVGVFVAPGRVPAANPNALDRSNRSYEYDGLGPNYARFLVEELLPEVQTKKTSDGRPIRISPNGNDHAIGGASSGAVCAFTAAWERPDQFSRVFSAIGTYVGLRGADRYPTLIRKTEPKPIRVFLQDGNSDQNMHLGDWWMANQMMERALTFSGYEVSHAWGTGGHSGEQGTAVFPDAMRWLWHGWPAPVKTGHTGNESLNNLLLPGEEWLAVTFPKPVPSSFPAGPFTGLAADRLGDVFASGAFGTVYRLGPTAEPSSYRLAGSGGGAAFGPAGQLFVINSFTDAGLYEYGAGGRPREVVHGLRGTDVVAAANGNIYVTEFDRGRVWLVRPDGAKQIVDEDEKTRPHGVTLSPDQTLLYVGDFSSHWVYSYQIAQDGTLQAKQQYCWLHVPDTADSSEPQGMCVDRDGRLYVATNMGIQVCDRNGWVNSILPLPDDQKPTYLTFGGPNSDVLYAASWSHLHRRKLAVRGAHAWDTPNKPGPPRF